MQSNLTFGILILASILTHYYQSNSNRNRLQCNKSYNKTMVKGLDIALDNLLI